MFADSRFKLHPVIPFLLFGSLSFLPLIDAPALFFLGAPWMRALIALLGVGVTLSLLWREQGSTPYVLVLSCILGLQIWCIAFVPGLPFLAAYSSELFVVFIATGLLAVGRPLQTCFTALTILALFQAGMVMVEVATHRMVFYTVDLGRASGTFGSPTQVATPLAVALPLAIWLGLEPGRKAILVGALLIAGALILTWSRGPILAATSGVLLVVWSKSSESRVPLKILISLVAIVCVTATNLVRASSGNRAAALSRSNQSRSSQALHGLEESLRKPFGVGPANIVLSYPRSRSDGTYIQGTSRDPKNQLLCVTLSFGFLGGLLFLFGAGAAVRAAWIASCREAVAVRGVLAVVGVLCIFDSPFFIPGHEITSALLGVVSGLVFHLDGEA